MDSISIKKLASRKTFFIFTAIICIVFTFNMHYTIQQSYHGLSFISFIERWMRVKTTTYLVDTSSCKIMDLNPHILTLRHMSRHVCPPAAFTVSKNILRWTANSKSSKRTECCFREIERQEQSKKKFSWDADWLTKTSKVCLPIPRKGLKLNSSFVQIECDEQTQTRKNNKTINSSTKYVDYIVNLLSPTEHSKETRRKVTFWKQIIKKNPVVSSKFRPSSQQRKESTRRTRNSFIPPNILILGINGMSRSHSLRTLPKTREFLYKNDFVEMKGFTKIGVNSFSNMMAALTGLPLKHECYEQPKKMPLDDCPFIWKNFSIKNYITAIVEDSPGTAMFNYDKIGFIQQPTDYTIRTALVALQEHAKIKRRIGLHASCMNGLTMFDNLFKYIRDFLDQMEGKYPFFLISWFKTLKRDFLNSIANEDSNFTSLLSDVVTTPRYNSNNTFIFLLSSHGQKLEGSLGGSYISHHEESLPINFIRMPPSLKTILPYWYKNLKANSKMLTTPFDLHATLQDILMLTSFQSSNNFKFRRRRHRHRVGHDNNNLELDVDRYSLFEKIPSNRSCFLSSIPELYCKCDTTPLLFNNSTLAQELGNAITSAINFKLFPVLRPHLCIPLRFNHLVYGRRVDGGLFRNHLNQVVSFVDYLVGIEVAPSLAIFETTVRDASDDNQIVITEVKRVSPIQNQSFCVTHKRFIDYCFCYESHLNQRIKQSKDYMKWSSKV